jgi:cyclase
MGSIAGWLEALEVLRALGSETIVSGHGPVCGPGVIDEVADYLRFVQETARTGSEAGLTPLLTAQQADLGRFSELLDRERLVGNLHRAYSELRGEPRGAPLPLATVVPDMVTYNGGQMPRCLAWRPCAQRAWMSLGPATGPRAWHHALSVDSDHGQRPWVLGISDVRFLRVFIA